jgi:hypothetical protein
VFSGFVLHGFSWLNDLVDDIQFLQHLGQDCMVQAGLNGQDVNDWGNA